MLNGTLKISSELFIFSLKLCTKKRTGITSNRLNSKQLTFQTFINLLCVDWSRIEVAWNSTYWWWVDCCFSPYPAVAPRAIRTSAAVRALLTYTPHHRKRTKTNAWFLSMYHVLWRGLAPWLGACKRKCANWIFRCNESQWKQFLLFFLLKLFGDLERAILKRL